MGPLLNRVASHNGLGEVTPDELKIYNQRFAQLVATQEQAQLESFEGELLDYPQYTRPREFRGMDVPEVLFSGDHAKVARWREEQARTLTARKLAREGQRPNNSD